MGLCKNATITRRRRKSIHSKLERLQCTGIACNPNCSSAIGYCPMLNGSSTHFSTIYTVMKNVQKMCAAIAQTDSVLTFNMAIYIKAKLIQWSSPDEFKDTVIRMGRFHIVLNFLALIGKKYQNSGLEDLLIESRVYGAGTATAVVKGKS